jgi:hypothetical protein
MLAAPFLIIAASTQVQPLSPPKPTTANERVMLGLLAVDLSLEADHGFYTVEDLLRDLRLGQRLRQRKPMDHQGVTRAFRGQGYIQGVFDALIDGVNAEYAQHQPPGPVHPPLCVSEALKHTDQMVDAIIEDLQRIPKEARRESAHMVVAQALLAPGSGFIVPCSPEEGLRQP